MAPDASQSTDWKHKYLDTLDELERREREWSDAESVLRLAISRVSLVGEGVDGALDRRLEAVRSAVRGDLDLVTLKRELDVLGGMLRDLEAAKSSGNVDPRVALEALHALVQALDVPRGLRRKARKLSGQLEGDVQIQVAVKAVGEFIGEMLNWVGQPQSDDPEPSAESTSPPVAQLREEPVERLAARCLVKVLGGAGIEAGLAGLTRDAEKVQAQSDLERFAQHLLDALDSGNAQTMPVHEVLVQLIDRLQFPGDLATRAQDLAEHLSHGLGQEEITGALGGIADLVSEARSQLQQEKRALEAFLKQLTERLRDIDQHVVESSATRREAQQRRRDFNEKLDDQVKGIGHSVEKATELEELKADVQERLDALQTHMERHRTEEVQRETQAEREIKQLTERVQTMEGEARSLRERVQKERTLAMRDSLTGIPNRLAFDERMAHEFARWKRYQRPLVLSVWDVDHFKRINDQYGHKAGDRVLGIIARVLAEQVRETDFAARYGGEEFVLLMPETDLEGARIVAEKLRSTVEALETHYRGEPVFLTISAGLTLIQEGDTPGAAFERADRALYEAKAEGRNRFIVA